jgi:hypothetical protein
MLVQEGVAGATATLGAWIPRSSFQERLQYDPERRLVDAVVLACTTATAQQ